MLFEASSILISAATEQSEIVIKPIKLITTCGARNGASAELVYGHSSTRVAVARLTYRGWSGHMTDAHTTLHFEAIPIGIAFHI